MNNYILSGFADEFDKNIDGQLAMMKEQNVKFFEPRNITPDLNFADCTIEQAKEIKKKMDDIGARASAIGSPLGKIKLSDDVDAHMDKTKHVCELASILECDKVRMFSFYPREGGQDDKSWRDEAFEAVGRMLDIAKSYNITFCHENEHHVYGETPERCLDLMTTFEDKIKCVFDMGNFVLCGHDPIKAYELLKNYIAYFHIKDGTYQGEIVPPGCGEAKIAEIIKMHPTETFVSLEPHLMTADILKELTEKTYNQPYVYENKQAAYLDAMKRLKEILA